MAQPAETSKALESEIFLSKYKYLKTVGKGSFGEAVLVRSKADNKRYIAKAIESAAMTPKEKRDVQNEIRILSAVNHPNIIRYQEHFEDGSLIFIIMEYADGGDLNQRIKDRKKGDGPHEPFDPKLAMFWFLQIAMALKFLHDKHILHRDLKTANIFLTSKDVVKLGDFGISTVLQNTMACAKTVCGTPYYFSPELCQSQPYNNKSDVWALGIVLYEMLTLNRPFNAKSLRELLKKILAGQYEPIPESVPAEVRQLCQSLLQSNPQMRPSVNRILEAPFVQRSLKTFSEELQSQTSKERREYEERKRAQAATQAAAPQVAAAPAAAPVAAAPAAPAVDMKDLKQMGAQGLRAMMMQQGAALQAEIEAQKQRAAAGPGAASPAGPVDDGNANAEEVGDLLAQKEVMLKDAAGMVGVGRLGGHEDEFGDVAGGPAQEETIPLASGQMVLARDARGALETEMGAPLVACALNFVNELMASPAAPSNAQIQRELNALLGVKYAQHSASITRLAVWESKHL